jgi:hypothetical protein
MNSGTTRNQLERKVALAGNNATTIITKHKVSYIICRMT